VSFWQTELTKTPGFPGRKRSALSYTEVRADSFDGLILPGGHAKSMRPYLESNLLQSIASDFFARGKPLGAICHGVLLAARCSGLDQKSVPYGKRTTALTKFMGLTARALTCIHLGSCRVGGGAH
jgi:protease I